MSVYYNYYYYNRHQKSMEGILEVGSGDGWPHNPATWFHPPTTTVVVSVPVKGTAEPVERLGVLQTLICAPVVRPKQCPTSSNPAFLPSWTVVCLSFTLLMMLLLHGWPTMGLNHRRTSTCTLHVIEMNRAETDNHNEKHTTTIFLYWIFTEQCYKH